MGRQLSNAATSPSRVRKTKGSMKRFIHWTFKVFFYLFWIALFATFRTGISRAHILDGLLFVTSASIIWVVFFICSNRGGFQGRIDYYSVCHRLYPIMIQ